MDASEQKRMREDILVTSFESLLLSTTSHLTTRTSSSAASPGPAIFVITCPVVSVFQMPNCHTLPIQIHAAFSHITLQLGTDMGCSKCLAICCIINAAAALLMGNLHFFATIAKAFPHTVAVIHSQSNYAPITLSGIVQQGGASVTTELTVGFQFHKPYLTRKGHPTTLSIATGPDITVNTILSLPFIQQTRMIIDAANQVANLWALDAPPFDIDYCRAMCTVPAVGDMPTSSASAPSAQYADIIKKIDGIVAFYTNISQPASILLPGKQSCRVNFELPLWHLLSATMLRRHYWFVHQVQALLQVTVSNPTPEPIHVAPMSRGKKRPNVFYDDRGFPNQLHDFDVTLHNINGGCILRKRKHPTPPS
jgi:hypothetical protein